MVTVPEEGVETVNRRLYLKSSPPEYGGRVPSTEKWHQAQGQEYPKVQIDPEDIVRIETSVTSDGLPVTPSGVGAVMGTR